MFQFLTFQAAWQRDSLSLAILISVVNKAHLSYRTLLNLMAYPWQSVQRDRSMIISENNRI